MAKRGRHTEGFTLAELLMSVAIVLILAAIAFPSIVSAQNNMRMLELNNAAQSIANAAQAQMTAKKVSGTWVDAVKDGDSYRACFPAARSADAVSYTHLDVYKRQALGEPCRYRFSDRLRPRCPIPSSACRDRWALCVNASPVAVVRLWRRHPPRRSAIEPPGTHVETSKRTCANSICLPD